MGTLDNLGDSRQQQEPAVTQQAVVGRMLAAANADTGENVAIIGSGRLDMVVELCRRGFARVGCANAGGVGLVDPVELLLIPDAGRLRDLPGLLARATRRVLAGGAIVLHDSRPGRQQLRSRRLREFTRFLGQYGFFCVNQESDGDHGLVLVARRLVAGGSSHSGIDAQTLVA